MKWPLKKAIPMLLLTCVSFGIIAFTYKAENKNKELKIGKKAPAFTLKNIDGKMVSLSDYQDEKGVIVIFTCNHCPYAKLYEDRIVALDKAYRPKGWPVVAINPNDPTQYPEDSYENMQKRAEEKGFTFPYLFDSEQSVYPAYGATRTPHVFLLENQKGKMKLVYKGAIDDNYKDAEAVKVRYIEQAIAAINKGEKPSPTETKAVGCSIKAKKN